jgi:hypothetical protein
LSSGLCLLGRLSTTWATPPALFSVGCFWDRVWLYAQAALSHYPPIYTSPHSWDDRHLPVQMESHECFCPGWPRTTILPNFLFSRS